MDRPERVVLFDGVCKLCCGWVRFIIPRDPRARLRLAPLQSDPARRLLADHDLPLTRFDTIVLIEEGAAHVRSEAVLRVMRQLRAPWRWLALLRVVPRPLRDWVYDRVAANRLAWFGRRESCLVPTAEIRGRFL